MVDVIQVAGDRIRHWSEINNPNDGPGTFRKDRSNLRIEFKDIRYDNLHPSGTKPIAVESSIYLNNGSLANTQRFSVNKKTTSSFTWTLKEGIETNFEIGAKIPILGGVGTEVKLSLESTQAQTTSQEQSWQYSTDINVPPHKKVVTSFVVNEEHYHVPFTAKVQVRGRVYISFRNGRRKFEQEISVLIDKLHWNPATFDYDLSGTFGAVHGRTFVVRVDESDIESTDKAFSPGAVVSSVVDSGVMRDNKIQSNFGEMSTKDHQD